MNALNDHPSDEKAILRKLTQFIEAEKRKRTVPPQVYIPDYPTENDINMIIKCMFVYKWFRYSDGRTERLNTRNCWIDYPDTDVHLAGRDAFAFSAKRT